MASPMQAGLIVEPQASLGERFCDSFIQAFKLFLLVVGTYGLMVGMFCLCLVIESLGGPIANISKSYESGGGILLGIFLLQVMLWGIVWCWGARKREGLRRSIVENQLAQIRAIEQAEEQREIEEERRLIESKRNQR